MMMNKAVLPNGPYDPNALPTIHDQLRRPPVFSRFRVAFYTRPIGPLGLAMRILTGSPYHCELVFNDFLIYSAAECDEHSGPYTKGVWTRFKIQQGFPEPYWKFVEIDPKYAEMAFDYCVSKQGCKYDYYGLLTTAMAMGGKPSPARWHCSEIVSDALMYSGVLLKSEHPEYYTPRRLLLELTTPHPDGWVE